jgi:hypothetical protein
MKEYSRKVFQRGFYAMAEDRKRSYWIQAQVDDSRSYRCARCRESLGIGERVYMDWFASRTIVVCPLCYVVDVMKGR